jgi:hypothetical protein
VDVTLLFDERDRSYWRIVLSEKAQTPIPPTKKKVSLRQFINENYYLFTTIGVIGGLAALFTRLENGELLSFTTFVMLLLLDFELWRTFPRSEEASVTLAVFEWLSQAFLFLVFVYLYMAYPTYFRWFFAIIVFSVFAVIFVLLDRKLKFYVYFRRILPEAKWYTSAIRALISGGIIGLGFLLAFVITNFVLDYLPNLMK